MTSPPPHNNTAIGIRLAVARRQCGLTQRGLAAAIGTTRYRIMRLEKGHLNGALLLQVAKELRCSIEDLDPPISPPRRK
jgi:DNA-binding XRE family transcriptional regulator